MLQLPPLLSAMIVLLRTGSLPAEVRPRPPPVVDELLLIVTLVSASVTGEPSPLLAVEAEWRMPPPAPPPDRMALSLIVTLVRVAL
jgi:hypothetical protein